MTQGMERGWKANDTEQKAIIIDKIKKYFVQRANFKVKTTLSIKVKITPLRSRFRPVIIHNIVITDADRSVRLSVFLEKIFQLNPGRKYSSLRYDMKGRFGKHRVGACGYRCVKYGVDVFDIGSIDCNPYGYFISGLKRDESIYEIVRVGERCYYTG